LAGTFSTCKCLLAACNNYGTNFLIFVTFCKSIVELLEERARERIKGSGSVEGNLMRRQPRQRRLQRQAKDLLILIAKFDRIHALKPTPGFGLEVKMCSYAGDAVE
jgi:hypothetical protein